MKRAKDVDKEGLNELIHLSKNLLRVVYIIVILGIFLGVIISLKQLNLLSFFGGALKVMSPLFIGFIIAWLFYPLHRKMIDKGVPKVLSAILIMLGIVGFILLFIYIFIPVLYTQINDLISYVPNILKSVTEFITNSFNKFDVKGLDISSIKDGLLTAGEDFIVNLTSSLPNGIIGILKGLVSALGIIIISFIIAIYVLVDFDNLTMNFYRILPKNKREELTGLFKNISLNARRVVNGTLLVAFMVFVCDTIGFAIVGLNAGVLFGLLCGITDLIPYIGPYIGGAAAVVVGLTQGPLVGLGTLIVVLVVQLVEAYILQPMVMSKAMNLHPVIIIVGLLLFGYFFGVIGMIVATPCIAIIKEILLFVTHKNHQKIKEN